MAVAIRLKRMGRKKKPFYRLVVADERNPRQGLDIDDLGYYDPMQDPVNLQIDAEKALAWLKDGAKPTDTARSLLSKVGIMKKFHEQRYPSGGDDGAQAAKEADVEDKAETAEKPDTEQEAP